MNTKNRVLVGAAFIILGLLWAFGGIVSWPLTMIGIGAVFGLAAMLYRLGALAIPGVLIGGLGVLFFGQNFTGWWASWLYVWPVVPGLVGLGLVVASLLGMRGRRVRWAGTVWVGLALGMTVLMWFLHLLSPLFSWALILVGLGVMFILASVLTGVGAQAIPGVILAGLGAMLYWQNLTGMWASWSYAWTLLPGFVGLGLLSANMLGMGGRVVRKVGLQMMAWSAVVFLVCVLLFAFGGRFIRLWPILPIVLGLRILQMHLGRESRTNLV